MAIPAGYRGNQWGFFYKESDNSGPYYLDADGQMVQGLPSKFYTDENGPYARLRVDTGQTGFYAGREFRAFHEFSLSAGATSVYRLSCPVNMILEVLSILLLVGEISMEAVTGGTEGGTFTAIPIFATNGMTTASGYATQSTLDVGGTHTGGTVRDLIKAIAGVNANQSTTTIIDFESPVGRAAIPLYLRLSNPGTGTATGVFKFRWEERP